MREMFADGKKSIILSGGIASVPGSRIHSRLFRQEFVMGR